MLSLLSMRFVFSSRDLDVLRAQRIIGFILITHKSTKPENPITENTEFEKSADKNSQVPVTRPNGITIAAKRNMC